MARTPNPSAELPAGTASRYTALRPLVLLLGKLREGLARGASREETIALLWGLGSELEAHFAKQERALELTLYPGLKAHRFAHAVLILNLHDLARELSTGAALAPGEALERFRARLKSHFTLADRDLASYVERARLLAAAETVAS
jgi:hemerythrin